jgi:hypothetical protein
MKILNLKNKYANIKIFENKKKVFLIIVLKKLIYKRTKQKKNFKK